MSEKEKGIRISVTVKVYNEEGQEVMSPTPFDESLLSKENALHVEKTFMDFFKNFEQARLEATAAKWGVTL